MNRLENIAHHSPQVDDIDWTCNVSGWNDFADLRKLQIYIIFAESLAQWHGSKILWSNHEWIGPIEKSFRTCYPLRQSTVMVVFRCTPIFVKSERKMNGVYVTSKAHSLEAEDFKVGLEAKDYLRSEEDWFRHCEIVGFSLNNVGDYSMVPMRNLELMLNKHLLVAEFFSSNG